MQIRLATLQDINSLEMLINSAYRGEESKKGWTTEADLLDGVRIDTSRLKEVIIEPNNWILVLEDTGDIKACVHLKKELNQMYLGMLTVNPALQNKGFGKKLLEECERFSAKKRCNSIYMTVISIRTELISWYERQGYSNTGEKRPFPMADSRFGIPKVHLEFTVLSKNIGTR